MTVAQEGSTVSVHYKGTLNDGTEFDNSYTRGEPITFQMGSGQMIKGFDTALSGMSIGEKKNFNLSPGEAYGEKKDDLVQPVPRTNFPNDFQVVVGATVQGQNPDGQVFMAKILDQDVGTVTLDFNHPLAGENLTFEVELVQVS
jgi:peptidylprolyl isomerase